jgi:hypothetical protein
VEAISTVIWDIYPKSCSSVTNVEVGYLYLDLGKGLI